jgi:hypothetical protein
MKTTRKTIIRADFAARVPGGGGELRASGEIGCVWREESGVLGWVCIEGSGIVDVPADRGIRDAAGIL